MSLSNRATTKPNQIRLAREMIGIATLCRMAERVFGLDFILAPFGTDVVPIRVDNGTGTRVPDRRQV